MKKYLLGIIALFLISGCTQIVTAPISLAGKAVSTTLDVAGSAGGAIVNTVTGGSDDD
jgi:uncharacterized protein YceK